MNSTQSLLNNDDFNSSPAHHQRGGTIDSSADGGAQDFNRPSVLSQNRQSYISSGVQM